MSVNIRVSYFLAAAFMAFALNLSGQSQQPSSPPLFKVGVETVFVKVSVTDPLGRYVTGLESEHFKVYEDKVQQSIMHFSQQSAPVSVVLIFDVSASMKDNNNIRKAKSALARILESANPEDEYSLITFNHNTTLVQSFSKGKSVQDDIAFQKPGGRTAMYDAVYMGLNQIKNAKNEKKALIIVTDGEDNSSRYSPSEVREFAKESDVQIYAIGEEGKLGTGRAEIHSIVSMTGGRTFFPNSFNELDYYIELIYSELRTQYVLGYAPTNKTHDGKWRRIAVKLDAPKGLPKLIIHAKEGYYAPKH